MKHIEIALSHYGQSEIAGKPSNPIISKFFSALGYKYGDETAWCSAFVNDVCKTAGLKFSGKLNARSWLTVGTDTKKPKIGDVVVLWRNKPDSWEGHVGFYIRETPTHIYMLGGNQGNQVNITPYPKTQLLAYRRVT